MAAEFYKKIEPSKNVVLSSIYRDMYMGQLQTANIGGGNKEQAYLARFTLPNNPIYGGGEIDRMDYHFYVNSIDLAQNVYAFPEVAIYKTKDSKRLSLTEGVQRINDTKTKDVLMFSSHLDGSASISEVFDGTKQAYGDAVKFIPVQRSIIRESTAYIFPRHLADDGHEITWGWGWFNNDNTSESDIRAKYGVKASELGITSIDDSGARSANQKGLSTVVCPVEEADDMKNWGKKNLNHVVNPLPGETGAKKIYIHKDHKYRIKYGDRSTIPSSELYGDELTPENSIFEIVRGAEEFVGEVTKGEAAVEILGMGAARLSNAAYLTGAQSCEMKTFWKKDTTKVTYPPIGTFTTAHYIGSGGSVNSGTRLGTPNTDGPDKRQEVMLCKKNVLYPLKHPSKPYRRGAAQSATSQDVSEFANNIEMDIKIKSLARAYAFGDLYSGNYTLRRAFIVAFSEEPPEAGETFFEFAWKHRDINQGSQPLTRFDNAGRKVRFMDANTLDYGRIETVTVSAAGSGYTANSLGTQAVTLDVTDAAGIPSSGAGQTFITTVSDGAIITATPKTAIYPTEETGYRVGDILTVTGGGENAKLTVATITRYSRGFAATAFLNTDQGVLVSDSSIVGGIIDSDPQGTKGPIGQQRTQWFLDETNKDVLISKSGFSVATEFSEGMIDQWLRLNFLVGAQSDRITPSSTVNPTAKALATAAGGSSEATMTLDGKEGTIVVGDVMAWDNTGGVGMVRVNAINAQTATTASIEVDKPTATWDNNDSIYFYTSKTGGFGESVYMVDDVATGSYAGMEDGTWGRLLISQVGDGQLIQRTKGLGTSNDKSQFWSVNSADGVAPYMSLDRWTRYMSIWLTNYPAEADVEEDEDDLLEENEDMMSSVFIDKIAFKDFNYSIENPNFNDRNLYPDTISIRPDAAMVGPDGAVDNDNLRSDKISQYNSNAPTMLSIGTTNPAYLGYKTTNEAKDISHYNWCSDRQGWLMLHNFTTENLANLAEIPDENICATYTHASGLTAGKSKWGECYNTHYGMGGFQGEATNPALHHNGFEGYTSEPATNIGLKYLWTGLMSNTNYDDVDTFVLCPAENDDDGPMGAGNRMHWPIRPGDTIVFPTGDDPSNLVVETALVEDVDLSGTENYTITTAANIAELDGDEDQIYIHPEGMVDNFSKKGLIFFDPNVQVQNATGSGDFSTTSSVNWARRECGPAASRVLDVVDSTAYSVDFLVDTLKPLKLDIDEQYIIYVYGGDLSASFFTSDNTTTTVDDSASNAKSGIYIKSMDTSTNIVTLEWDGKANDGTQMITEANLPALMISPYRYWIHMNVDCSSYESGAPTTTLPLRKYDSFSVMDHDFGLWDGSSYHIGTLAEDLTAVEIDVDLTSVSGITAGDSIMIDEEVMYVRSISSTTLTVIRGASGTWTDDVAEQVNTNDLYRTGVTHDSGAKVKNITVHSAGGEHMSGNATKMTKDGALGGDGTAASGLTARRNLGSTYAEYLINHESSGGVNGAYINRWKPTVLEEGTIYETQTDFGFGSYDAAENDGGQLANQILRAGEYNVFKMYDIKSARDFEVNKQIDLLIKYKDDTTPHVTNINTRYADTKKPFGIVVFKDTLPVTPNLSVKPHEEDPFLPEFKWEASDEDLWYGLLHIDSKAINSQYHNAILHLPFNEEGDHSTAVNTALPKNKVYYNNSDSGTSTETANISVSGVLYDVEGLAGNCLRFDGSDTYVDYNPSSAATSSITVDEVTSFVDEQTFVLIDTAGTTHTFTIKDDSNATSSNNVGLQGAMSAGGDDGNTAAAVKIAASINAGTCASTITATSSLAVVTLTQDVSGADGNTTITNTAASGDITVVDFTGGGNTFTDITDELTFIFHIVPDIDISGATNLICANKPVRVNFDATTSQIDVRVYGGTGSDYVELKSSAIPVNGETPTAIIVTFDKNLKAGNCKLFIDGRLEDQSGVAKSDMDSGANNNWASPDNAYVTGVPFRVGHDTNAFDGRIEEVVVYNKCLYPIVPSDGSFVFSKPIKEISNSSPIAHTARLFVKDYHNIRGSTSIEVASSSPVSWRKSSFRLVD